MAEVVVARRDPVKTIWGSIGLFAVFPAVWLGMPLMFDGTYPAFFETSRHAWGWAICGAITIPMAMVSGGWLFVEAARGKWTHIAIVDGVIVFRLPWIPCIKLADLYAVYLAEAPAPFDPTKKIVRGVQLSWKGGHREINTRFLVETPQQIRETLRTAAGLGSGDQQA